MCLGNLPTIIPPKQEKIELPNFTYGAYSPRSLVWYGLKPTTSQPIIYGKFGVQESFPGLMKIGKKEME